MGKICAKHHLPLLSQDFTRRLLCWLVPKADSFLTVVTMFIVYYLT